MKNVQILVTAMLLSFVSLAAVAAEKTTAKATDKMAETSEKATDSAVETAKAEALPSFGPAT